MSEKAFELVLDEEKQILSVVSQNGLSEETAQSLTKSFAPLFREASALVMQSRQVIVTDASQKVQIKLSREYRLAIRQLRIKGEATRKQLKEASIRTGKAIDGANALLLHAIGDEETRLDEQEKIVERAEAARKEALKTTRQDALKPFGFDASLLPLGEMSDETFAQLLENTKAGHEAKLAAARRAKEEEIAAENARLKEQARIREENERLKREADEREAAAKIERERIAKEKADAEEALRVEREVAAKEAARIKAESDAKIAEQKRIADEAAAKAKIEADAKAAKIKAEADKAAKELAEKNRIEREAADLKAKVERDAIEAKAKAQREEMELAAAKLKQEQAEASARLEASMKAEREKAERLAVIERNKREKLEAEAKAREDAAKAALAAEQAAARKAAAAPDKAKMEAFSLAIRHIPVPAFSAENARLITLLNEQRAKLCDWIEAKAGAL